MSIFELGTLRFATLVSTLLRTRTLYPRLTSTNRLGESANERSRTTPVTRSAVFENPKRQGSVSC